MRISPLDMRQQRFKTAMRGYDRTEVVAFLTEAADDYEHAMREIDRLRSDLMRMEALLAEHRERENNLRDTLLTAQRLADELKETAQTEAKLIVREAQGRADLLHPEGAGPARRDRPRHQRAEAAPPRRRRVARGDDPGALPRARVHPRPGSDAPKRRSCSIVRARPTPPAPERALDALRGRPQGGELSRQVAVAVVRTSSRPSLACPRRFRARDARASTALRGDAMLVRLAAPPVDGAANDALVAFLADASRLAPPRHLTRVRRNIARQARARSTGSRPRRGRRRRAASAAEQFLDRRPPAD